MKTIFTFFLNYEQHIILFTICFFAGMAWRHHRLISRLFIIAASCLWVIYVYRYQIAVGWPALATIEKSSGLHGSASDIGLVECLGKALMR